MITDEFIKKYFRRGNRIMKSYLKKANDEILNYLSNRYVDSESLIETLYRIFNGVERHPVCKICGNKAKFFGISRGFSVVCDSKDCLSKFRRINSSFHNTETQKKVKQSIYEKYGVSNPYQIQYVKEKALANRCLPETIEKRKKTCINKYGVDNPSKSKETKEKISNVLVSKTDDQKKKTYEKHKKTCKERYGVDWYSKLESYKKDMSKIMHSEECLSKRKSTSYKKYGVETYNNQELRNRTLKENNTYCKSKWEDVVYEILSEKFCDVIRQYSSSKFHFNCDFYIPSIDTYIEFNGSHYHHNHPYDETNIDDINELRRLSQLANNSKRHAEGKKSQYDNIIYTWTDLDVRKRQLAKENNLNFIEFWSIDEAKEWVDSLLVYSVDENQLQNELNYYLNTPGRLSGYSPKNEIVKYFQQNEFFKYEKKLWKEPAIREKLTENRIKYLNKDIQDLTDNDLLVGFKRSGIHYGYSHFNPLIFKWFIQNYNVNKCYDPCGGWGHRLLSATNLESYIYNDLSKQIENNVKRIANHFNIDNVIWYNEDARKCCPENDGVLFDAIFTCPPYANVEDYGINITITDVNEIIKTILQKYKDNDFIKTVGIVIREDLMTDTTYNEKLKIKSSKPEHFMKNKQKRFSEYLYIWKRL